MVGFEEAYRIAKELKPTIDGCTEYENGYVFGCSEDEGYTGGEHSPCVILKEDGRAVTIPYFIAHGTGEEIREIDI